MYSNADKLKAVQLFHQYDRAWATVLRELGYPSRSALKLWVKQYAVDSHAFDERSRGKFSAKQHKTAVDYYFDHGHSSSRTVRILGYPSRSLLDIWVRKDPRFTEQLVTHAPDRVKHPTKPRKSKQRTAAMQSAKLLRQSTKAFLSTPMGTDDLATLDHHSLLRRAQELELQNNILKQVNDLLKKDLGIDQLHLTNKEKMQVIDALRDQYPLKVLLLALELSKSSYFYQHKVLEAGDKYAYVRERLKVLFSQNYSSYGYRRMREALLDEGIHISEKVIRRLMAEEGLVVKVTRCRKYSSYAGEITPAVANLLERNFKAEKPNEKLVTDITEFAFQAGKVYLSPLIDCFDGQIISWSIGTSPNAELVSTMLKTAAESMIDGEKPIIHSDRGAHYRWPIWIDLMGEYGFARSMSKKACTPDNAAAESFFGHLKTEFFYNRSWRGVSIQGFMTELDTYIEWYNTCRKKISLGGMSP
ncbi:IS3 family transposase [Sporolactobacillus kofuensis]|uniref:IS3 family transposase n=1 Tax=Sporolactobacillus kofuensis TaxID=269672 RepID=A0ABW1WD69_9BACL|nr:IS3 family transposase [Sporolactobacillus kofuensis]MCO7175766.1 IS3 family transposase [Sporolactobacillus kofuensis]